jgi:hypothetical protein
MEGWFEVEVLSRGESVAIRAAAKTDSPLPAVCVLMCDPFWAYHERRCSCTGALLLVLIRVSLCDSCPK